MFGRTRKQEGTVRGRIRRGLVSLTVLAAALTAAPALQAQGTIDAGGNAWDGRVLSDWELDSLRGGFIGVAGITYFAIDLDTWINNQHVYSATWIPGTGLQVNTNIPDPNGEYSVSVTTDNGITTTIQNGVGNSFVPAGIGANGLITIVQNNLDGALIQHSSTINLNMTQQFVNQANVTLYRDIGRQFLNGN
ncbi:MAG: hypothetical protein RLO50_19595 [Azospirillaceae bacterium]